MMLSSLDSGNENGKIKGRLLSGGDNLCKHFKEIHDGFPSKFATPRGYLNFLHTYIHLFNQKKESIENKQKHLQVCKIYFYLKFFIRLLKFSHIVTILAAVCNQPFAIKVFVAGFI